MEAESALIVTLPPPPEAKASLLLVIWPPRVRANSRTLTEMSPARPASVVLVLMNPLSMVKFAVGAEIDELADILRVKPEG